MRRSLFSPPEPFSLSPLLALLPDVGDASKLASLTSSLFARYEKVAALQRDLESSAEPNDPNRRLHAEGAMLKTVLDWLAVTPDNSPVGD